MEVYIILELLPDGRFVGIYGVYKSYNNAKETLMYLEEVDSDCAPVYHIYKGKTNKGVE